jgi:hypothetical protein
MTTRTSRAIVHFKRPFRLKGVDRLLSPGDYQVITDEELIEGLSFASFRRIATMIMVPGASPRTSSMEMVSVSPADLSEAQRRDAGTPLE